MTADRTAALRAIAPYLESWLAFRGTFTGVPGLQASVRIDGESILDYAWGYANAISEEPLTTKHLFRIASHSKTMTATAILQLKESDDLRLDDTVESHLPELTGTEAGRVSIRELLGHQAGMIRDGSEADFWQRGSDFPDREALIACVRSEGAVFGTNARYKYSNIGYSVLGLVVEAASGRSYNDYVSTQIVDRLHLDDFGPEYVPARSADFAAGHTARLRPTDPRRTIGHVDTRAMAAATGWYSTASDLTQYGTAHTFGNETLISDESKRLAHREESRVSVRGELIGRYGLGFDLRTLGDREVIGHSGGYPGHITRTWIDSHDAIVVSVLTNSIDGQADALATGLFALIDLALGENTTEDTPGGAISETEGDLEDIAGRFANMWGVIDITTFGQRLIAIDPRQPNPATAHQTLSVEDGTIRTETVPGFGPTSETVRLDRDDDGYLTSVHIGGMTHWPIETYRYALDSCDPGVILGKMSL